jgi:hypothetical protein
MKCTPASTDHLGVGFHRLACQRQAVPDDIGDAMEDLGRLVVVREYDGVAVALEIENCIDIAGKGRPFDSRYHGLDALIERRGAGERVDGANKSRHGTPNYAQIEHLT